MINSPPSSAGKLQMYSCYFCEQDIDECEKFSGGLCQNGGTCMNRHGSYLCICGQNCTDDVDECSDDLTQQCFNKGKCVNLVGCYKCECAFGYTRKMGSSRLGYCTDQPCQNGGICYDDFVCYECQCNLGPKFARNNGPMIELLLRHGANWEATDQKPSAGDLVTTWRRRRSVH
uniref:EGF-like domain-containing protein n=1 Tax=Globodera pallida TaxID=36090 RepID=A0A183BU29_GLOPA